MENRENERMILDSVQNGPLVWPTIFQEDGTTRKKTYAELSATEKLQADYDCKATNIVLQGLPPDMVTVQQVHGRQGKSYASNSYKGNATSSGGNNTRGHAKVVKCYNCQGEGHMARKCTQAKRPRNVVWFKEKAMLAEAQEAGQILDDEQLAFLADPGIPDGQAAQTTILNTAAFQTEDVDAYDSNCDDVSNAKAVLMANLSNYGSNAISEVSHFEPYHTDMDHQSVHAMQGFKQTPVADFTYNEITTQLQAKDTTICKLKEHIKSMRENDKEEKVKHEMDEIETINIKVEHSVAKLLSENERLHKEIEHLKKIYKDQFDSIKKTCALSKEHGDFLIAQLNSNSMEHADLKRQIQDKVFVITSLKNVLQKLKGKETVKNAAQIPIATTIAPGMFKIDLKPLALRLFNNRNTHIYYLKHTYEQADILWGIVKKAKAKQSLDNALDFACKHAKEIQELLVYVRDTCPNVYTPSEKLIVVTPINKIKKDGFSEPLTSSSNIQQRSNAIDVPPSSSLINDMLYRLFSDLEVAFRKNTCFIQNLECVDLLSGSRDTNLYTISLDDMLKTSSIYLLSKASKTKSWLWHRRDDWDNLFQPMFDEYFNPPTSAISPVPLATGPRAVDIADSPVSTSIDQDTPSTNSTSQGLSSNVRLSHTPVELIGRWIKDHPIANVTGDPSHSVFTKKQLKTDVMWCYFDAFLTSVEPKNFKQE
uniref:Integrase, catalytic region, zinc finger, CCHC-type, peptidase aspartic, catalytic n=1 Tax=Tanacetum cinerariifolium TaxID=118510 RepID=A0A699GKF9_TANCI|nr:integrase, catalytic region, zinc finger, CCHC-type, peptidase aspartic, catalytic [Tanacetum cinerariifolium]